MSLNKMAYIKTVLLAGLVLLLVGGCTKTVKQESRIPLPPVQRIEEKPKKIEEEPQQEPTSPEMQVEDLEGRVEKKTYPGIEGEFFETSMLKDCYFDFDRYELTPEARRILAENFKILKKIKGGKIQIEGHCDERGTKEYNLALGERRAASVKNYLISLGIAPKDLSTISYGEEMPVDLGHNEEAWAKNRRAHIIILSMD